LEKPIEFVAHSPGVHLHLEEELVDREVERIEHPVFPLIHDPERLALAFQKLRAAVVAVHGLRKHEGTGLPELGLGELPVEGISALFQGGEVPERIGRNRFETVKVTRVVVAGVIRRLPKKRQAGDALGVGQADEDILVGRFAELESETARVPLAPRVKLAKPPIEECWVLKTMLAFILFMEPFMLTGFPAFSRARWEI